jgi:hypothetical protein
MATSGSCRQKQILKVKGIFKGVFEQPDQNLTADVDLSFLAH